MTLSAFLPDVVHQIVEEDSTIETNESNENFEKDPSEFTGEDFPPLPPPANLVPTSLYDQEYPPLSSTKTTIDQTTTLNNEFVPSPPEDLLGNRTLFKQVKNKNLISMTINSFF